MGPLDLLNHLLNFVAPAAAVALCMLLAGRWVGSRTPVAWAWWVRWAVLFVVGMVALGAGLVLWGRDGKILTYAALVLACATCQWCLGRGWKA